MIYDIFSKAIFIYKHYFNVIYDTIIVPDFFLPFYYGITSNCSISEHVSEILDQYNALALCKIFPSIAKTPIAKDLLLYNRDINTPTYVVSYVTENALTTTNSTT